MRQLLLDFDRAPAPTFANFVTGANAELTHALESATHGTFTERVIYVWGEAGAGKTHLLKALVNAVKGSRYFAAHDLADADMKGTLAVDGVERLPEDRQVALFNAFNERTFDLLVVSASASPREVPIRRDLATRLATGLTYRVVALTDAEKGAALAAHAKTRGFAIPEDVTSYLLTHARRDMGSLIGALDSLDRYSMETGRPITIPLLKAALQPGLA
ncbi:MAG TPA: DnaA regulatory inactivator Hda [Usitatibacter sp.]|jgi:DnaA family protein|nr:DnaA regulatory inactivator Hda [Usitatibacter sp.]